MKRFLISSIFAAIVASGIAVMPQDYPDDYLGLPGDNLNLYAVMKLFQDSETIEGFERSLNDENNRINNLDLNNDNYIDYIKVVDYVDKDVHTIVLQDILGRNESQDVAVFTVQRLRDGSVQIQLIGDEALYGRNYIIEPYFAETPNPGYTGRATTVVRTNYVQVSAWPLIRFIFMPNYVVWRSNWYWGYYPSYWHPWRPFYWHYYYGYHYHWYPTYYEYYHRYDHNRWNGWNSYYYRNKRVYSRNVTININKGVYKTTYSRPDQRRDGEALYAKVHPERASTMSPNDNRRPSSAVSGSRQNAGPANSSTRRSSGTVNNNSNGRSQNQNVSTSRRSTTTVNQSRSSNPSGNQNNGTVRRSSTTTVTERTTKGTPAGQNNGNVSRSSSSGSNNRAVNRSTTTVNNRANSGSEASRTTVTNKRSSTTTVKSAPTSRSQSSGQRAASSGSSSSRQAARSSQKASKQSTTKQSSRSSSKNSKEPESKSSRRN